MLLDYWQEGTWFFFCFSYRCSNCLYLFSFLMKKTLLNLLILLSCSLWIAYGLSFAPHTIFLDFSDQEDCEKQWGSYTSWYEEEYCTIAWASEDEKKLILDAGEKILKLIWNDQELFDFTVKHLRIYIETFMLSWDHVKAQLAEILLQHLEGNSWLIPSACTIWYDWCNSCYRDENWGLWCTEIACLTYRPTRCTSYE